MIVAFNANTSRKENVKNRIMRKNILSKASCSYADMLVRDIISGQSIFENVILMDGDLISITFEKDLMLVSLKSRLMPVWGSSYEVSDYFNIKDYSNYIDFFTEVRELGAKTVELEVYGDEICTINRVLKDKNGNIKVKIGNDFDYNLFSDKAKDDWDMVCMRVEDTGFSGLPYSVISDIFDHILDFINMVDYEYDPSESYIVRLSNKEFELGIYFSIEGRESFIVFNKDIGKVVSLDYMYEGVEGTLKYAENFLDWMKVYLSVSSYIEIVFDGITWTRCNCIKQSTVEKLEDGYKIKISG